ncbi:MAG: phage protein Gp27 family protein [Sphingomonadales bacterium]
MAGRSSIESLDPDVRKAIDRWIARDRRSIDQILTLLAREYEVDHISRSAVGRHAKKIREVAREMAEAREIAAGVVAELGDEAESDLGRVLVQMLHTMTFRWMKAHSADEMSELLTSKDFMNMARAVRDAAHAMVITNDHAHKLASEVAKKAEAAADKIEAIAIEGGLSRNLASTIRQEVLGVRVKPNG